MSNAPKIKPKPAPARRRRDARSKRVWVIGGLIGVAVLVAAVIAIVVAGGGSKSVVGVEEFRPVTVSGSPLPRLGDTGVDSGLGATAPTLAGQSFDGTAVKIGPGRPTLVIFAAHWCPHCRREIPLLVKRQASGAVPAGLDIFGVSTEAAVAQPNYPPSKWLQGEKFPWPVLVDDLDFTAAQAYGLPGFPYFVLFDSAGKVRWRRSGEIDPAVLGRTITPLLKPT